MLLTPASHPHFFAPSAPCVTCRARLPRYDYETNANVTLVNDALLVLEGGFFAYTLTPLCIGG